MEAGHVGVPTHRVPRPVGWAIKHLPGPALTPPHSLAANPVQETTTTLGCVQISPCVQLMVDGRHGNHTPPVAPPVGLVPKRLPGNVTALLQKMAGNLARETRQIHGHVQIYRHVKQLF